MLGIGGDGLLEVAGAHVVDRALLPGLDLPPVDGQLRGAQAERRARKPPPAAMEANWRSSPTSTTLAPAARHGRAGGRAFWWRPWRPRPPPAPSGRPAPAGRGRGPAAAGRPCGVGEAFLGQADGGDPGRGGAVDLVAVQLERLPGHPSAQVLPEPARPTTTATPAPPWVRSRTMAAWSSPALAWRSRTWRTTSGRTAQPWSARSVAPSTS